MSFTVVIPTVGRPSLVKTLESIAVQRLLPEDEVIIAADDNESFVASCLGRSSLPGRVIVCHGPHNDWGHTGRNLATVKARGDYLTFMDDDDWYLPGAFAAMRPLLDHDHLHLFRMKWKHLILPHMGNVVAQGNVSTQMVVVPNRPELLGRWTTRYEGDLDFITETAKQLPVLWHEPIIAQYGR